MHDELGVRFSKMPVEGHEVNLEAGATNISTTEEERMETCPDICEDDIDLAVRV